EEDRPGRVDISRRVLTPEELAAVAALPEPARAREVLIHFALKEAFYKATSGLAGRPLWFQDVAVESRGRFVGPLLASEGWQAEGAVDFTLPGHLLATVRVGR